MPLQVSSGLPPHAQVLAKSVQQSPKPAHLSSHQQPVAACLPQIPAQEPPAALHDAEVLSAATVQTVPVPQVLTLAHAPQDPTGQTLDVPLQTALDVRLRMIWPLQLNSVADAQALPGGIRNFLATSQHAPEVQPQLDVKSLQQLPSVVHDAPHWHVPSAAAPPHAPLQVPVGSLALHVGMTDGAVVVQSVLLGHVESPVQGPM